MQRRARGSRRRAAASDDGDDARGDDDHAYGRICQNAGQSSLQSPRPLAARLRRVRGAGAIALREFSGRVAAAAARRCGRTSRRCTRSRGVADDIADEGTAPAADRLARLHAWQRSAARRRRRRRGSVVRPRRATRSDRRRARATRSGRSICRSSLFDDLVSAFGQDTMTTRYASWADVLRLLPPIGESGRPTRAAHRRLSRRGARSIVGRALHGAAAHELLAGLRPRLARRPAVRAARRAARGRRARERPGGGHDGRPAWTRGDRAVHRHDARAVRRGRAVCDGVRGRLRFELRFTWLGGTRILERVERGARRAVDRSADARRARRARACRGAPRAGDGATA